MTLAEMKRWMRKALQEAEAAAKEGEAPVGAVLLLRNGQSFAAHNATRRLSDPTAHAEMLALRAAARATGNERLLGAFLFVTIEPCCMCAGAIVQARIAHLIYAAPEPKTGAVESRFCLLADPRHNHRLRITAGVLEDEARQLMQRFFAARRGTR